VLRAHVTKASKRRVTLEASGIVVNWNPDSDEFDFGSHWTALIPSKASGQRQLLTLCQVGGWMTATSLAAYSAKVIKRAHNWVNRLNKRFSKKKPRPQFSWNGATKIVRCHVIGLGTADGSESAPSDSK
jgi:hypothetical protein